MKIIFMGTSSFGLPTLKAIIEQKKHEIVAIYTKEPKKAGRGHRISYSPIYKLAAEHNLKILTPKTLKDAQKQQEFTNFQADLAITVSYGLLLPQEILDAPKYGCINLHPSLLPRWRGAAPLHHVILSGDKKTAMSIIEMTLELDAGNIIKSKEMTLDDKITYKELHDLSANYGADLTLEILDEVDQRKSRLDSIEQDSEGLEYAVKINKEDMELDFSQDVEILGRKIRALGDNLGTYFYHNDKKIKIIAADIEKSDSSAFAPGHIDDNFTISCLNGLIKPKILQREGKKAMPLSEFLRGFNS